MLETREHGVPLKRQAVLFRSSHHSDVLELELVRRNIPYVKYGGLKFLEAAHVKDVLAVLRWADNPRNRVAAFRALQLLPGLGPVNAARCFTAFEARRYAWARSKRFVPPALAQDDWPRVRRTDAKLGDARRSVAGADAAACASGTSRSWSGCTTRPRSASGDLVQLERIAAHYRYARTFLTELALDPPQATGDLAGTPLLDEDYLVLSTVHSAKGQEWEAVYVLNVADGNFPTSSPPAAPSRSRRSGACCTWR